MKKASHGLPPGGEKRCARRGELTAAAERSRASDAGENRSDRHMAKYVCRS